MTNEEQKAYHAKQEQERLNNCKIKTLEQFLDECKKVGIDMDWFSFTCDRSKPVSMDDDTVYYGKSGETIVAYDFQRWDVAFRELLIYKEESEWEATGAPYRITSVKWKSDANIQLSYGNTMMIREYRFSEHPEQEMLDDGWVYDHYDRYMGYSVYYKKVSTGSIMRKSFIVFTFTKRTDKRDAETFGFEDGSYLIGSYRYPVPHDLRARIMSERDFKFRLSEELRKTLTERLAKNLIEDEFNDLRALQEAKRNALDAAFDPRLSAEDQKKAFARASNSAEVGSPAADNYADSRCHIITHNNLRHAYERAGLDR